MSAHRASACTRIQGLLDQCQPLLNGIVGAQIREVDWILTVGGKGDVADKSIIIRSQLVQSQQDERLRVVLRGSVGQRLLDRLAGLASVDDLETLHADVPVLSLQSVVSELRTDGSYAVVEEVEVRALLFHPLAFRGCRD